MRRLGQALRPEDLLITGPAYAYRPPTLDDLRNSARPDRDGTLRFPSPYAQMSVSLEEADLLYALIRALKPLNVLELGAGLGLTARFIAEALAANGDEGFLISEEPLPEFAVEAIGLLTGVAASVVPEYNFGPDWPHLVYIDSGVAYRAAHIQEWLSGQYSGLVVVHDADRAYKELRNGVGAFLPTANGFWVGRSRKAT